MISNGRLDLPLSLCFAAVNGDDILMHRLLKRGVDPNESEHNGRTALVCFTCFNYDYQSYSQHAKCTCFL